MIDGLESIHLESYRRQIKKVHLLKRGEKKDYSFKIISFGTVKMDIHECSIYLFT